MATMRKENAPMISPQTRARPNQTSNHNRIKILQLQSHSILTFFLKLTNLKKRLENRLFFVASIFHFLRMILMPCQEFVENIYLVCGRQDANKLLDW